MDYLKLLQRADFYEISGNRITSYCTTLGGGSINYWDGRRASFNPQSPLCNLTAFAQVIDLKSGMNLLQEMYHFWRPDRVVNKFHSHRRSYVEEEKTIWDDTFVSVMNLHSEHAADLILRVEGFAGTGGRVSILEDAVVVEEVCEPVTAGEESRIFKVIGLAGASPKVDGSKYSFNIPLHFENLMETRRFEPRRVVLVVAGGDTEAEAVARYRAALSNPEALFEARKAHWEEYFKECVPAFSCSNPEITKMYYFICYMVEANRYSFGRGFFKNDFESTGKYRLLPQWFWDSAFGAMNEKWLNNTVMPKSSMSNTLESKRADGLLPFTLGIDTYVTYGRDIIQPFILPMAVWDYYLKSGDRSFIERALSVLTGFDKWMSENRDANGEGLVNLQVPGESGWDNSKRYIPKEPFVQEESPLMKEHRYVQSPDFNTYVCIGRRLISRMARELDLPDVERDYALKAERTAAGILDMWNGAFGLFLDRFEDNHEEIPVRTPGGAIPMLAGLGDEEKWAAITDILTDPQHFWTEYPLPTLDLADADFNSRDEYFSYWNGRVWPNINWVVAESLCRAGRWAEASELIRRTMRMVNATGEAWCMENYHPDTGYPYFTHNIFNYIWGGMAGDMLLRRVAGIQGDAPRDRVYVNPLMNADIEHLSVKDVRIGAHSVDVELRRDGEGFRLRFTHRGGRAITLVTSAGETPVENAAVEFIIQRFDAPHWLEL